MISDASDLKDRIVDYIYKDKNRPEFVTRKMADTFVSNQLMTHGNKYSLY